MEKRYGSFFEDLNTATVGDFPTSLFFPFESDFEEKELLALLFTLLLSSHWILLLPSLEVIMLFSMELINFLTSFFVTSVLIFFLNLTSFINSTTSLKCLFITPKSDFKFENLSKTFPVSFLKSFASWSFIVIISLFKFRIVSTSTFSWFEVSFINA